ncbi:MAG: uroporphyrinogen-III C-methyltransferase [Oscillospiraceae bacterium]|nr:uroporphyrinogen-III C-methyltransferase [Oscillospiraceae bacterium]
MSGKVYLVGAGPSDPGLLTLRGKEVLERAEVVVYDALVSPELLALLPAGAECINVGKRASHHLMCQEDINRLLLQKAREGRRVVRLKGGDPFLFGRGGEELELLCENGIPYEIVPGVTSAIAVPAYCGIPVTHRDFCSSLHIVTGHKKQDEPLQLPFRALAETKGTLVFLMGLSALRELCAGLIAAGMDEKMPAAILQKGTTAEQRALCADLATLPRRAEEEQIETPAILVVGGVCALREKFAWREALPLFGCRVLVTRPRGRAGSLAPRLRDLGAQVIEAPTIRTEPIRENEPLRAALGNLGTYAWLAFTSPYGVEVFLDALAAGGRDIRQLASLRVAAIGTGTAAALRRRGLFADLVPETYDAGHLGKALRARLQPGETVLIPRAKMGSPALTEALGEAARDLPIYETFCEKPAALDLRAELEAHPQTVAVFTSASTVRGFAAAAEGLDFSRVRAACIGRQTACEAEKLGMQTAVAEEATLDSLILLVQTMYGGKQDGTD